MVGAPSSDTDRRVGRYVLGERIGKGGMAEVFIGHALGARGFRKPVAIKRLLSAKAGDLASTERLIDEAKLLVGLQHGNVVSVLDLVCEGDNVFVVMEYVDGPSLRQLVRLRDDRLPISIATYVVHAAALGLEYAHAQAGGAVIHADISPSNLLLTRTGEVRVADFGIARREGVGEGFIEGKWAYMAPEQARGELLSPKADVFALGVVLYELISGARPRPTAECVDPADIAPLHLLVPEIPRTLSALCRRCLARDPADRPTMVELRAALLELRFSERWRDGAPEVAAMIREAAVPVPRMPHSVATSLVAIHPAKIAMTVEPPPLATGTVHGLRTESPVGTSAVHERGSLSRVLASLEPSDPRSVRGASDAAMSPVSISMSAPDSQSVSISMSMSAPDSQSLSMSAPQAIARSGPDSQSISRSKPASSSFSTMSPAVSTPMPAQPRGSRSRVLWIVAAGLIAGVVAAWIGYGEIQVGGDEVASPVAPAPPMSPMLVEEIETIAPPITVPVIASEPAIVHEAGSATVTGGVERAVKPPVGRTVKRRVEPRVEPTVVAEPAPRPDPEPAVTIDVSPRQTAAALVASGTELFLASKLEQAREAFQGAIAVEPTNALAHRGLGFIYQRTGATDKAIAALERYLVLRPGAGDTAAIEARIAKLEAE